MSLEPVLVAELVAVDTALVLVSEDVPVSMVKTFNNLLTHLQGFEQQSFGGVHHLNIVLV